MYSTVLAAALSGASVGQLRYWRRQPPVFAPEYQTPHKVLYSYRDVVALRSITYLRQKDVTSLQDIRKSIKNLRAMGKIEHLSEYKLVRSGNTIVLVDGDEAIDLLRAPGNAMLADLVDIFGEFDGRMGRVLPFQQPVPGVVVDPEVLSGFPVVKGTRIGYDQVASLMDDDVPAEEISRFFPSVGAEAALAAQQFADYVRRFDVQDQVG
ncbi:DUF433 domain-containing protein [Nonomuraea rubra]|uniref:Uncharacterized protein (DUF433 family)/DNA-binding transcriptional MerR regulator n=1 Tax=Nonomuraea rubra TaxID=46180 RepID=A0A7X0NNT1_9ACTN|nr:DUF433 domain-containing protein [Nonomuraea rubra]MBB6546879.1 uncharacterized protein (DUF433 family)/DNA-binding transcriptional MerR regulator [Nonomuraea rubra]